MSNIFRNVPSYDPSDPEKLKTQKIESEKQKEEWIPFQDLLLSKGFVLQATFFYLLKCYMETLLERKKADDIRSSLFIFRSLLNTLSKQNLSESPSFAIELSRAWLELLHNRESDVANFCQIIKSFPKDKEHTLG